MYSNSVRAALRISAALLTFVPVVAHADEGSSADALDGADAILPAEAQASAGASNDIVVTARRRSETAQDIPIAVTVVGGQQITEIGAFNVARL